LTLRAASSHSLAGGGEVARLSEEDVRARLAGCPGWELAGDEIRKVYSFPDFKAAMAFVNRVADLAEAANHHPDILINYNRVTLSLTTHDSGGLTDRDFRLAGRIDG
jgi:4a-hydroxytetrahydrobiopterin dehydratase